MKETHYTDSDIQVLEGLEAVRKRPGMYIGSTGERGLHHLVWEIVDNAVDEALAGFCDDIEVMINKGDIIEIRDDGRGIPTGINAKTGLSTVETIFTVLHAGGKFGGEGYKVSGGLHGVGASVVNALSKWLEVKIYRDGNVYYQRFENGGHPVEPLKIIDTCDVERTGSTIIFKPDEEIFTETTVYNYDTLYKRLQEIAFLNKGLRINLYDLRQSPEKHDTFLYNGGIIEYVEMLNKSKTPIHDDIIYMDGSENGIEIEVACQYNETYSPSIYSFTNNINTYEGGTHEDGVKAALTKVINNYAKNAKILKENDAALIGEDCREGLTMIISCKHPDPQFEGQTKTKLGNSEVRKIASDVFSQGFERFLMENPNEARTIVEKCISASRGRIAAKKAREATRRKSDLDIVNFGGKLVDCKEKDPSVCEIFLVEGDSAGGSAIKGRNSMTQAILPLKGKVLNVEKARLDRALSNDEIKTIITAFGTGIGQEFDLSKMRYHKVIIMTDADVDGSHIRILLLTFFYRYMQPLIEAGHVYIAQPPLYKVEYGKTVEYAYNDAQLEEIRARATGKMSIQRYKGLGEMDYQQLSETTMDPAYRTLLRVSLDDAIEADRVFDMLMGEKVEPRKKYILENAKFVTNLDI